MQLLKHSHGDSKLKCQDCEQQICPKCMVQCAVGFRCRDCTKKFGSHLEKFPPLIAAKALLAAVIIGGVFGLAWHYAHSYGTIGIVAALVYGYWSGRQYLNAAKWKIGWKVFAVAIVGLLIGLALTPGRTMLASLVFAFMPSDTPGFEVLDTLGKIPLTFIAFLAGFFGTFFRR